MLRKKEKVEFVGETYIAIVRSESNTKVNLSLSHSAREAILYCMFLMEMGTQEIKFDLECYMKEMRIKSEKTARGAMRELCAKGVLKRISAGIYEVNKGMYYADNVE